MRLYWELASCGFRRTAIYRSAAISGAITNTFFGFLRAYIFIAVYEGRADVGGYSLADALAFTFITQGMAALIGLWGWWQIAESVQTGQVARSYLALDQGMVMAAATNALSGDSLRADFTRGAIDQRIRPLLAMEQFSEG